MIGIYKITNNINNKSYIGQSINITQRWINHKSNAKNLDYQTPLYRAIRKYGIENFSFEILEECQEQDLNDKEIYWIKFFDSFGDKGYNLTLGGGGTRRFDIYKIVNLYKQNNNIKQTAKEIGCHPTTVKSIIHSFGLYGKEEIKAVEKINPITLEVIASYSSLGEASNDNYFTITAISNAASGKTSNCGGFYWRFTDDKSKKFKPIKKLWKRKVLQMD